MNSLNRTAELERVVGIIREKAAALSKAAPKGAVSQPVHMSIVAPSGGGLSLFLADVNETLSRDPFSRPVTLTFESTEKWEIVVVNGLREVAADVGWKLPQHVAIDDLFALAKAVFKTGKLLVLVIDAGRAIASIEGDERWRGLKIEIHFFSGSVVS